MRCGTTILGKNKNFAFTLAEVLITLGIIGVVAAMTLPTLVQNYRKHVVETRLAKFYSVMAQAIMLSEVNNGDHKTWETFGSYCTLDEESGECQEGSIDAINWYNKYLKDYLKVNKVRTQRVGSGRVKCVLYFADGSAVSASGSGIGFYPVASDLDKYEKLDKDGNILSTDISGIKSFTFFFYQDNEHSAIDVFNDLKTGENDKIANCNKTGGPAGIGKGAYCAYLIKKNGWKIPKDYPFKF